MGTLGRGESRGGHWNTRYGKQASICLVYLSVATKVAANIAIVSRGSAYSERSVNICQKNESSVNEYQKIWIVWNELWWPTLSLLIGSYLNSCFQSYFLLFFLHSLHISLQERGLDIIFHQLANLKVLYFSYTNCPIVASLAYWELLSQSGESTNPGNMLLPTLTS